VHYFLLAAQPSQDRLAQNCKHWLFALLLSCCLQGLWNGTVPGLLLTIPYTAVQFVALQQCKEAAAKLGWGGEGHSHPTSSSSSKARVGR
jgi:hypothetical protein